jgi:hypothetical protein
MMPMSARANGGFDAGHHLEQFTAAGADGIFLDQFAKLHRLDFSGRAGGPLSGVDLPPGRWPQSRLVTLTYHRLGVAVETICVAVARIGSGRPTASFTRSSACLAAAGG